MRYENELSKDTTYTAVPISKGRIFQNWKGPSFVSMSEMDEGTGVCRAFKRGKFTDWDSFLVLSEPKGQGRK
jgi:hypothetical protein